MFCRICGKSIFEEISSEFDGTCLDCVKIKMARFSRIEESKSVVLKRCILCENGAVGKCFRCHKPICYHHAHIYTKYGAKHIHCNECWGKKSRIALMCAVPMLIIILIMYLLDIFS